MCMCMRVFMISMELVRVLVFIAHNAGFQVFIIYAGKFEKNVWCALHQKFQFSKFNITV